MKPKSKKEIKEAIEQLKNKSTGPSGAVEKNVGKLPDKKSSQRIRKQGV